MKRIIVLFIVILLFVFALIFGSHIISDAQPYDYSGTGFDSVGTHTYIGYTSEPFVVEWDSVTDAASYDVRVYSVDRKAYMVIANTLPPEFTINFPRVGMYVITTRAKGECMVDGSLQPCEGNWSETSDPNDSEVDGQPKGWMVYVFLAPPGPIE